MRLELGPAEPASAAAWIQWADEVFGDLGRGPAAGMPLSAEVVNDVRHYLEQWRPQARSTHHTFRWRGEIDADQLEYLVHAFFKLDVQLMCEARRAERSAAPDEARGFYLVLVRALLRALETDSPSRAAFVDHLRSSWPIAVATI